MIFQKNFFYFLKEKSQEINIFFILFFIVFKNYSIINFYLFRSFFISMIHLSELINSDCEHGFILSLTWNQKPMKAPLHQNIKLLMKLALTCFAALSLEHKAQNQEDYCLPLTRNKYTQLNKWWYSIRKINWKRTD